MSLFNAVMLFGKIKHCNLNCSFQEGGFYDM